MKHKFVAGLAGMSAMVPVLAHACSVCVTGASDPTADAFNSSVIFLMATPYAVMGSIAAGLFYGYRRSMMRQKTQEQSAAAEPLVLLAFNPEECGR